METPDVRTMSPILKRRQLQSDLSPPYTPPESSTEQLERMEYCLASERVRHYSMKQTGLLICATLSDSVILGLMLMTTYMLRWTSTIPFYSQPFYCNDSNLNSSSKGQHHPLSAEDSITTPTVLILSFTLPILMILISEMLFWVVAGARKPDIHLRLPCCPKVTLFQAMRRLYRFVATYLFGAAATMIMVDILKNTVGRLRPSFLNFCTTSCPQQGRLMTISDCSEQNFFLLRDISTSFPSLQSAISMYAAVSTLVYLHGISKVHHSKYLITPLISLSLMAGALICSTRRVVLYYNWWSDIIVGHIIGAAIALYLTVFILRCFDPQVYISNRKLMDQMLAIEAQVMSMKTNGDSRITRGSIEMYNFRQNSRKNSRVVSPQQMNTSNPSLPGRQMQFNENSNTFRDDLRRTLNAINNRSAVNENDEVFY